MESSSTKDDEQVSPVLPALVETMAIVNPVAGSGRTRRVWPALRRALEETVGPITVAWTTAPGEAETLTRRALRSGVQRVVAVGGDGTLSEVINGFFERGTADEMATVHPDSALAYCACGTGGDFRRTIGAPADPCAAARNLALGRTRRIDVGTLTYTDHAGHQRTRAFGNIASFGMGGAVDEAVQAAPYKRVIGGTMAFLYAILNTMARYENQPVDLAVDGEPKGRFLVRNVAVANGRFFGGGLEMAPRAAINDGFLDVVVLGDMSRAELLRSAHHFYRGTHERLPGVSFFRGRQVTATSPVPAPVLLDVDGEPLGRLPATFKVLPQALQLHY